MNIVPNEEIPYESFIPPYEDFINNWEKYIENAKDFDIYMLGNIPSFVYVALLKKLKEEKDKNNKYIKSLEDLYSKMQQEKQKVTNTENTNKALKQAYYDLINLQERGYIIYD